MKDGRKYPRIQKSNPCSSSTPFPPSLQSSHSAIYRFCDLEQTSLRYDCSQHSTSSSDKEIVTGHCSASRPTSHAFILLHHRIHYTQAYRPGGMKLCSLVKELTARQALELVLGSHAVPFTVSGCKVSKPIYHLIYMAY